MAIEMPIPELEDLAHVLTGLLDLNLGELLAPIYEAGDRGADQRHEGKKHTQGHSVLTDRLRKTADHIRQALEKSEETT